MKIQISWKDITRQHFRCGGPGGQAVNKTESGVRLIHNPTGIRAQATSERSQNSNLIIAIRLLLSRLFEHFKKIEDEKTGQGVRRGNASFSRQTRSYFLDKDRRVVDHETAVELPPGPVLNGKIDELIQARLIKRMTDEEDQPQNPLPRY